MAKQFNKTRVAVIGGGAGGFFAAISCMLRAQTLKRPMEVRLLEAASDFLVKVRISGGGRCNLTHHCYDPREFCESYPRGQRELLGPMQKFQAEDTVKWFESRGIAVKAESDGRMFPKSDESGSVVDCLVREARWLQVRCDRKQKVQLVERIDSDFMVRINDGEPYVCQKVVVATGSSPVGYKIAKKFGHTITELVPSLFTFKINSPLLKELGGISFPNVCLELLVGDKSRFSHSGPLLITHWGLSGPAVLKLSAWAARELKGSGYKAKLTVNWLGAKSFREVENAIERLREIHGGAKVRTHLPPTLTKRFWSNLLLTLKVNVDKNWRDLNKKELDRLVQALWRTVLQVEGKSRFKEEFVECGGVALPEIDFKRMESKLQPGLHFVGEVLDVDGLTGGFNLQNAWTTGWIAGKAVAEA